MNRVALRLGTECVIKDLSLIADPSWTYHHQLVSTYLNLERQGLNVIYSTFKIPPDKCFSYLFQIAESTIINSLQPRLNLDPTPCLEKLCNSVKKVPPFSVPGSYVILLIVLESSVFI
jgi:hypothetical protein